MLLKFAVKEYLEEKKFQNASDYTLKSYKTVLNEFYDYCTDQEVKDTSQIDSRIIKSYLRYCKNEKGNKTSTVNGKIRITKAFVNYLLDEEILICNTHPFKNIKQSKEDIRINTFTDTHIKQILRYFERQTRKTPFIGMRNRMTVLIMLGTGVRVGEIVNITWNDLDIRNGYITTFGKKRQSITIPLTNKLLKEIIEYKVFTDEFFDGKTPTYMFPTRSGKKWTQEGARSIFKRLKDHFNFDDVRLSAHTLRHSFASRSLRNGMDITVLKEILHHQSLQMSQRYVDLWGSAVKEMNDKFNPLNDLDI
ncbi:tyrosine-type recombinase/integrase [Bacillus litorisediminis]|uniref:tyrosine-type recombinase/integrase n=1 Tax=Bacillus litorisediminis TaxID=2922713 RepID=UPI001FAEBA6C|nr:tyrosine-type recombinase/integrase [Bacillus litorisediminis]